MCALALLGCGQEPPGASAPGHATSANDGLSGLALQTPLPVQIERLDPKLALDATTERLRLRYAGGELELELTRNDALISPSYRTYEVDARGVLRERASAERPPFCHFLGHVVGADGADGASVSVTTCDADGQPRFSGLFRGKDRLVELRAATTTPEGYELALLELPASFDDSNAADAAQTTSPRAPALAPESAGTAAATSSINVEILGFNDAARQQGLGGVSAAELSGLSIANSEVNVIAGTTLVPHVVVGLVGQLTFTNDPYTVTQSAGAVDATQLLPAFAAWGANAPLPEHDERQLLTGFRLQGTTIGLSFVGSMCNKSSSASLVEAGFSTPAVAVIASHELGHTLGMLHDSVPGPGASCGGGFIMAASNCVNCAQQPTDFSSCSEASLTQFLATNPSCLNDPITPASGAPACGNGVVEAGEQCDCGNANCGTLDPCCNGATCQLKSGASCSATQACCSPSLCAPLAAGTTCRAAISSCDLAEKCDGSSALCPANTYASAGQVCSDPGSSGGLCYQGGCLSRTAQCTAAEADYPSLAPLAPCETNTCGVMHCGSAGSCYELTAHNFATGTPCGTGKQCNGTQCVASSQLNPPPATSGQAVPALGSKERLALPLVLLAVGLLGRRRRV